MKMIKKIFFLLLLLSFSGIIYSQSNQFWISNPTLKGKLTFQNGWTLYDTLTGVKLSGNLWLGGSTIFFSDGLIVKDSLGSIVINKNPRITTGVPWINSNDIGDTSISASKIKNNSITTKQFASTTFDSIFSTANVGNLSRNLQLLVDRYNVMFSSSGKLKKTVLGPILDYDTTANLLKIDTSYFLKSRDSLRYLLNDIDTSGLFQKKILLDLYLV